METEPIILGKKKINRLIIVGNGFDLSLGLKTSYKDFLYNYLIDSVKKSLVFREGETIGLVRQDDDKYFIYDDELIGLRIIRNQTKESFEKILSNYTSYDELYRFLKDNNYLTFNSVLLEILFQKSDFNNWIDIEVLYYDTLVNHVKSNNNNSGREKWILEYNDKFNKLRLKLIEYLSKIQLSFNQEHQQRYRKYVHNFFSKIFQSDLENIPLGNIMFLNFNYTKTIESLIMDFPNDYEYQINHIHGNLDDEDSVIFGYGDELDNNYLMLESERSKELFKYIKSPHYFQSPSYKKLSSFIDSTDYEVYILGHSCGISDRTLLNEIFENKNCKSIRIFYYESWDSTTDKLEKSIEIMRHFKDKVGMRKKIKDFTDDDLMVQV